MMRDRLTADDLSALSTGHCSDCGYRGFVFGPRGGESLNIECGSLDCRSRFNVTIYAGQIIFGQRIEKQADGGNAWPSEPRPRRMVDPDE